jgi:Na+-driven multidrug efflux pump
VFALALIATSQVLPEVFTDDPRVVERAETMWPLLVAMMPFAGAVFALDGILIGAGDTRYLAVAMVISAAIALALAFTASAAGWGIAGVWAALCAFIVIRLVTCLHRFAGRRWAVEGGFGP